VAPVRPSRRAPVQGQQVLIAYFGGERVAARVVAVGDGGRSVEVLADSGQRLTFSLNGATAQFVAAGDPHGARLVLRGE